MSVDVPVPLPSAAGPTPAPTTVRPPVDRVVPPVAGFTPVFTTTTAPSARPTAAAAAGRAAATGHWLTTAVTSAVLTAFAVLIVSGRVVTEGPVVLVLSRTHGVHLGDLGVLAAWCAGVAAPLARGLRRASSKPSPRG